ncbi:hypothetical protein [Chromobacterium violaceum]|uniref:hypothetical protein n=1 Tax=Chromobacterium violaceum TaxID=536 RepID=UPI00194F4FDA|nr:hypothetical protein [Chromobacterium violaceum]QRO34485.1 hypothetical protein I6K04_07075 [Chromobacterium violaceum]QRQ15711.1 hypothetical protein I6K03_15655 [Chromobacterium violaceum]
MRRLIVFSASNGFSSVFFSCLLIPDFSEIFFLSLINAGGTFLMSGCRSRIHFLCDAAGDESSGSSRGGIPNFQLLKGDFNA